jgi:hypothetical protein
LVVPVWTVSVRSPAVLADLSPLYCSVFIAIWNGCFIQSRIE